MLRTLNIFLVTLLSFLSVGFAQTSKPKIGTWRDHLAHSLVDKIALTDTRVYVGGPSGLFYYDKEDGSVNRMTKVQGFSDFGVTNLAYYKKKDVLVITYDNSNIDLYINDRVYNISDLKRSTAFSAKGIRNVTFEGNCAYLSCDFGILVLDLDRKEIYDTYAYIGEGGSQLKVNAIAFDDTFIYTATERGLYYADKNDPLLMVYERWNYIDDTLFDSGRELVDVEVFNNKLIVALKKNDVEVDFYYRDRGAEWKYLYTTPTLVSSQIQNQKIFLIHKEGFYQFDKDLVAKDSLFSSSNCTVLIKDGEISNDGFLWFTHQWGDVNYMDYKSGSGCYTKIEPPSSPQADNTYRMTYSDSDKKMLLVPGGFTAMGLAPRYFRPNVFTFESNRWKQLDNGIDLSGIYDFLDVAVDPYDNKHYYAASGTGGIVEIKDNKPITLYDDTTTDGIIARYYGDIENYRDTLYIGDSIAVVDTFRQYTTIRTVAVEFDSEGNLWVLNSLQDRALIVRYKDGEWANFYTGSLISQPDLKNLMISKFTDYKWFFGLSNQIFVHDGVRNFGYVNPNNGNDLGSTAVNCLAEDKNGVIWVGTDKGAKVIYNTWDVFSGISSPGQLNVACATILAKDEINDDTRYLLENTSITAIAIDGANRKWVGTQNAGVFLFSENLDEQLLSFTEENSTLFSNNVQDITINQSTGEVFFVTDNGVVSYVGEATETQQEYSDVYAYPNPIKPDYDGPIAIKGLVENTVVHIADVAGNVVFTTQALGGQAIWDGRNLSGRRVATGVYLVFAADKEGEKRTVTKLLFIK